GSYTGSCSARGWPATDTVRQRRKTHMATLTVFEYDTPDGADRSIAELGALQEQRLIKVLDAAVVRWENGQKKPQTRQLANLTGAGAMQGAFWGLLFGLIFWVPLIGIAVGAGLGAL